MGYGVKLALGAVLLVVFVGVVIVTQIDRALEAYLRQDLDARLEGQAMGAAHAFEYREGRRWASQDGDPDELARKLGQLLDAQVTILDDTGKILGDSNPSAVIGADESNDVEVRAALSGAHGFASRPSGHGEEMRYVAVRVGKGAVLRVGESLSSIRLTIVRVRARFVLAAGLGGLAAVALGIVLSRLATRPLRAMRDAAQRIAQGDYAVSLSGRSQDEFGEVERSLSVLAERLARDRDRIDRLERTRRDFVANVSHQLRTPITAIQGYAETLLRGTADAETARRFLETMHRQARRVSDLVTQLLRLSELEGRVPGDAERWPVRVGDVVREAIVTVREGSAERLEIVLELEPDVLALANAEMLEQVVENLVENAVRHAEKSPVHIAARRSGGRLLIEVTDGGPGISDADLPRVFERFYRGERARLRSDGGAGLGLAIVKHLVESMRGTISVHSGASSGARFTVSLEAASDVV
jgi:signal transduction histidine kinase